MDHYTVKALWIYWARGDDEVKLTDEESFDFDDEAEVAKIFRIETNVFDFETPLCWAFKEFNYLLKLARTLHNWKHTLLPRFRMVRSFEGWKTQKRRFKNKAIMDGMIDKDDESSNEGWKRWDDFEITNHNNEESKNEMEIEEEERCELFDDHEQLVCYIKRFKMIKYSFRDDEEYVAIKENDSDDLVNTSKDAIHAY
nr:hypothetical protein [Tanacetum cinerariifolium]